MVDVVVPRVNVVTSGFFSKQATTFRPPGVDATEDKGDVVLEEGLLLTIHDHHPLATQQ
jgi:hypothetical protein